MHGGSQDRGRRPGTENVAFAVGLHAPRSSPWRSVATSAHASTPSARRSSTSSRHVFPMPWSMHATPAGRPTSSRSPGTDSESLLMALDLAGVAASSGSACQSGSINPSHVLAAIGVAPDLASAAIRMSLGALTTEEAIGASAESRRRVADDEGIQISDLHAAPPPGNTMTFLSAAPAREEASASLIRSSG